MRLINYIHNSIPCIDNFECFIIFTCPFKVILENSDKSDNFSKFPIYFSEMQKKVRG